MIFIDFGLLRSLYCKISYLLAEEHWSHTNLGIWQPTYDSVCKDNSWIQSDSWQMSTTLTLQTFFIFSTFFYVFFLNFHHNVYYINGAHDTSELKSIQFSHSSHKQYTSWLAWQYLQSRLKSSPKVAHTYSAICYATVFGLNTQLHFRNVSLYTIRCLRSWWIDQTSCVQTHLELTAQLYTIDSRTFQTVHSPITCTTQVTDIFTNINRKTSNKSSP